MASGARTSSPELVGRHREVAAVRDALARRPAVVLVDGEAGVGKSRLVDEALSGTRTLTGVCLPHPFPYGAVIDALASAPLPSRPLSPVTGALRPWLPELTGLPPTPTRDPRSERHHLYRAVRDLLDALGPVVLVIEDLHWADDETRHLLRFLMADPPAELGILVTYRPEEMPGGLPLGAAHRSGARVGSAIVRVPPLSIEDARLLAIALSGQDDLAAGFVERLHEWTAGVPSVIEETMWSLDGDFTEEALDGMDVPVLLRDAVAGRLAALPAPARRLTQVAAVLDTPAAAEMLGVVGGVHPDRVDAALEQALAGNALHEKAPGRYWLRHSLDQRAVYESLSGPDRHRLHVRAIRALERFDPLPLVQLAEHSRRAGRIEDWLRYGEAAADRAEAVGETAMATTLLRRLLTEPTLTSADVDRLGVKLGRTILVGLDRRDPVRTLDDLLRDPRLSGAARGEVRLSLGLLLVRQAGGVARGKAEIELAAHELAGRPALAAKACAILSLPFLGDTPLSEVRPWLERTTAHLGSCDDGEIRMSLLANVLPSRMHGDGAPIPPDLVELPRSASSAGEARQLARAYCNVADAAVNTGRLAEAGNLLHESLRLAADSGSPFVLSIANATRVRLDWLTGRWSGLTARATALLAEHRDLLPVATELNLVLGELAFAEGHVSKAVSYFARTGARTPEEAIAPVALAGCAGLAEVWLVREDMGRAVRDIDKGVALLRRKEAWAWAGELLPVALVVYLAADRLPDAHRLIRDVTAGIDGVDAPMAAAAVDLGQGLIARHRNRTPEAVDHFRMAGKAYRDMGAAYLAVEVGEQEALCALERDPAEGARLLPELIDRFDELGAVRDAARCRHLLRGLGRVGEPRRGRNGYGNELSPRERDVARLLAEGHTNREIADVLFVSPRTVEQHVTRVLRKLGASSRTELRDAELT